MFISKKFLSLVVLCFLTVLLSWSVSQASISNDTTFGNGQGYVAYDLPANGLNDYGESIVIAPDGRIIVTGRADQNNGTLHGDMGLWVLNSDGSLDISFAGTGYVTHNSAAEGDFFDEGKHVMLDSSGRIIVIGSSDPVQTEPKADMAIWRYNPNGTLDTTFNGKGYVTHNNAAGGDAWETGEDGTFDGEGNIIVAGQSYSSLGTLDMVVWKYTPDGSLDTTFNGKGFLTYDRAGQNDEGFDVEIDASGRIIVAGHSEADASTDQITVWRINDDGTLDNTFGTNGVAVTSFSFTPAYVSTLQLSLLSDGKMLVGGPNRIVRLNEDGSVDTTFGPSGTGSTGGVWGTYVQTWQMKIDGQGRIQVVGKSGTSKYLTFWRYTADGLPDTTFNGGSEYMVTNYGTGATSMDSDFDHQGRIVVTCRHDKKVAVLRFVTDEVADEPDIQAETSLDLGNTAVNSTVEDSLTVHNYGIANLTVGTVASLDGLALPFSITSDGCSTQVLAPNASCDITVQFAPTSAGAFDDTFDIPSDDPDESSVTISVSGTGTAQPEPDITVTDSVAPVNDLQVAFGTVSEGSTSDQTVTVTNDGAADLTVGTVASVNGLASPFSITADGCSSQTLAPTEYCELTVQFGPSSGGSFDDTFDIPSDDPDESSVIVGVTGTGEPLPVPDIHVEDSISPTDDLEMDFGSVDVGLSSSVESIEVYNDGTTSLTISNIELVGTDPEDFTMDIGDPVSCGSIGIVSLGVTSCTIDVAFTPQSEGTKSASVRITSDDPDEGTVDVALSGTGLSAVINDPPSIPALLYPADGQTGLDPRDVTLKWTPSTDPEGGEVTYELYLSEDPTFKGIEPVILGAVATGSAFAGLGLWWLAFGMAGANAGRRQAMVVIALLLLAGAVAVLTACGATGGGSSGGSSQSMSHTETDLSAGTTYYWKVVARDADGKSCESEVRSFTTK